MSGVGPDGACAVREESPGATLMRTLRMDTSSAPTVARFLDLAARADLHHHGYDRCAARPGATGAFLPDETVASFVGDDERVVVVETAGGLATVGGRGDSCWIWVACASQAEAADAVAALRARVEAPDAGSPGRVDVTFWVARTHGPDSLVRTLHLPAWDDIMRAYPARTRRALLPLMAAGPPSSGSLIVWHGPPGTGKTNAVRALVRAWRTWCTAHVLTEPETVLGARTGGLSLVLEHRGAPVRAAQRDRWKLLVLEDAGELLGVDAPVAAGQGLGRLLNLSDGLLGEGLRTIVLVTTNEPLRRLHPAVTRPGRALANVAFGPLAVDEANAWLAERGVAERVEEPATVAELAGMVDGARPISSAPPASFGFAPPLAGPAAPDHASKEPAA